MKLYKVLKDGKRVDAKVMIVDDKGKSVYAVGEFSYPYSPAGSYTMRLMPRTYTSLWRLLRAAENNGFGVMMKK